MIEVIRRVRTNSIRSFDSGLIRIGIVAVLMFTVIAISIAACPSFDWCLSKWIDLRHLPGANK
jgi:hypothetical protein